MNLRKEIARRLFLDPQILCFDGIRFRNGDGPSLLPSGFWINEGGMEAEMWNNATYRPLELAKILNGGENLDLRFETGLKHHTTQRVIGNRFYRNLMICRYLIDSALTTAEIPLYGSWSDEQLIENFNTRVSANISCIKALSYNYHSNAIITQHIKLYGDVLRKQIADLSPNMIYIYEHGSIILNRIVLPIYSDLFPVDEEQYVLYSPTFRIVVINGHHPSSRYNIHSRYIALSSALMSFLSSSHYNDFVKSNNIK